MAATPFVSADVGNARIKLGLFDGDRAAGLSEPLQTLAIEGNAPELDQLGWWLANTGTGATGCLPARAPQAGTGRQAASGTQHTPYEWSIASVNRRAATRLVNWIKANRPEDHVAILAASDLPLEVRLDRPDLVGIDRLVDAVAVNRLRQPDRAAIVVDVGTAITVDLVSADGAFLGGAILPGLQMAARAMHEFTDRLPLVDVSKLTAPPPALGTATEAAMQSGLFWGAVGAIRELIERLYTHGRGGSSTATPTNDGRARPQVFLTGGAGAALADLLGPEVRYVPNLALCGIALAAKS